MDPFNITDEDKEFVRKSLGTTVEELKRDTEILKQWLKQQRHLPQGVQDDAFFEGFLIRSKCRVEKAKEKIDQYYTMKTIWSEVFEKFEDVLPTKVNVAPLVTFKLTKNRERIFFIQHFKDSDDELDSIYYFKVLFGYLEIINKYDYSTGLYFVADMENFTMNLMKKLPLSLLQKFCVSLSEFYTNRFLGIHYCKSPPWINFVVNIVKPFLKPKLQNRIYLHPDYESLRKYFDLDVLPTYMGGKLMSLQEMREKWDEVFLSNREFLASIPKLKSDETQRVGECKYDVNTFGVHGTFKKLNLD